MTVKIFSKTSNMTFYLQHDEKGLRSQTEFYFCPKFLLQTNCGNNENRPLKNDIQGTRDLNNRQLEYTTKDYDLEHWKESYTLCSFFTLHSRCSLLCEPSLNFQFQCCVYAMHRVQYNVYIWINTSVIVCSFKCTTIAHLQNFL